MANKKIVCKKCGKKLKKTSMKIMKMKGFDKNLCFVCNRMNEICKEVENNINENWLAKTKNKKVIKINWNYDN
jgi:hypothetical protein